MEGSNTTPYLFVKEIFLNIIIALRRFLFIFCYILNVFTLAIFFVCSFFVFFYLLYFVFLVSSFFILHI